MEHTFYVTIQVTVKTDLEYEDAVNDFEQNCDYQFDDTDNIIVLDTDWLETKSEI